MQDKADEVLAELLSLNGSSAGARPKALIGFNREQDRVIHGAGLLDAGYEPWLVIFANTQDGPARAVEFVYAEMARRAGIDIPETHIFPAKQGPGYFAIHYELTKALKTACGSLCITSTARSCCARRLPTCSHLRYPDTFVPSISATCSCVRRNFDRIAFASMASMSLFVESCRYLPHEHGQEPPAWIGSIRFQMLSSLTPGMRFNSFSKSGNRFGLVTG